MTNEQSMASFEEIRKIGNRAVRKAQADNHAKGLPNVYSKNGVIYWQLPDGTITMQNPLENDSKQEAIK